MTTGIAFLYLLRHNGSGFSGQQRRFDDFRTEFNEVRPHEALDQETPASRYEPSPSEFPTKLPPIEYPDHFEKRLMSRKGGFRWASASSRSRMRSEEE